MSNSFQAAVETTDLTNGVRIVSERMPHVRSVAVGIWVATGSRRETTAQNGISHFIEHMLFKGTGSRSAEDIAKAVDSIGGNLDAFTSRELVSFNTKVLDEHLPRAFDVISDLVLNPLFRAEDIEKEKGVILEEIKMDADNPEYLVHESFCKNFWKDHALGRPILGTPETVASFDQAAVRDYYQNAYTPGSIVITGAGNLRHEELVALAEKSFAGIARPGGVPPSPTPGTHAQITLKKKRSLEQVHVCMGVPSHSMSHEARFTCYVLNALLGGGMSSRLFQNIREKQALAYSVFSELNMYSDTGCLAIYAGCSKDNTGKVVDSILAEFRQLKDEAIGAEELRRAKDHLKGSLMLSLESTSSRMSNLARQAIFFGRYFTLDELIDAIEAVTVESIQALARRFFQQELIGVSILGPLGDFKLLRGDLAC